MSYLNEMPYCATVSKPLFHTSVTSQALVADRRHERKADTELPPTRIALVFSFAILTRRTGEAMVMERSAACVHISTSLKSGYWQYGASEMGHVSY